MATNQPKKVGSTDLTLFLSLVDSKVQPTAKINVSTVNIKVSKTGYQLMRLQSPVNAGSKPPQLLQKKFIMVGRKNNFTKMNRTATFSVCSKLYFFSW